MGSVVIAAIVGYFLGALPFGYLVARAKGINIFEHGSKNPGATNVRRVLGKGPGNLVFFLDALKGAVAVGWLLLWRYIELGEIRAAGNVVYSVEKPFELFAIYPLGATVALIAALVGHSFSCFTKFKGGKGVATATGGLLVLMPLPLLVGLGVWLATFYSMRFVSLASMLAAVSLPITAYFFGQERVLIGLAVLVAVFVVLRHRTNIGRLLNGTESKFARAKKTTDSAHAELPANPTSEKS